MDMRPMTNNRIKEIARLLPPRGWSKFTPKRSVIVSGNNCVAKPCEVEMIVKLKDSQVRFEV